MIKKENVVINEKMFVRTFSDQNYYIYRNGLYYKEAYDLFIAQKLYEETKIPF